VSAPLDVRYLRSTYHREIFEDVVGERQDTGCPREIGPVNEDEGLSAVAQTLGVVHGISKVVMEGAPYFSDFLFRYLYKYLFH